MKDYLDRRPLPPVGKSQNRRLVNQSRPARRSSRLKNEAKGFIGEHPLLVTGIGSQVLRYRTRRDLLLFGAGALAALAGAGALLPQATLGRLGVRQNINPRGKEWLLNKALRIDDDVAEVLYSTNRTVPTYTKSQITRLRTTTTEPPPTLAIYRDGI
jgi:hypothetical protein